MRRLPVYLLLDTSGSMMGEAIESVKTGLQMLVTTLRQDAQALETAYLSVITFDSSAKQVVPLTALTEFQLPELNAGGGTALGEGLALLARCRDSEVQKTTKETKGDWKPLVFIMTDGAPTDDWQAGLAEFQQRKWGMVMPCAAGMSADAELLKKIAEPVVQLANADSATLKQFFKWVSSSISASVPMAATGKEVTGLDQLPPPPPEITIV